MLSTDKPALYAAYVTGREGSGVILLYIKTPIISGIDGAGVRFDGTFVFENGFFNVSLNMQVAAGTPMVTGTTQVEDDFIPLKFKMPIDFENGQPFRVDLPFGPANVRFERLKSLDNA